MRILGEADALYPFDEPAGALPCLGRPLAERARDEARRADLDGRLTLGPDAFVTEPVLRAFAARARGPSRLVVPPAHPSAALLPGGGAEALDEGAALDVFLDAPPGSSLEGLRASTRPVPVAPAEAPRRFEPFPGPAEPGGVTLPAAGDVALHVRSWAHLLWLGPLLVPLERARGRARRRRGAARPSVVGAGADVHPRALLDGAVIGPGASIGDGAHVVDSYVGAGAVVSDFARLRRTVLEADSHVLTSARFTDVVALGRGSLASFGLRSALLGRDVFLTSGVIFWHDALDATVTVHAGPGRRFDSGRRVLGGAAGHGAVLGARTLVAPGRALPGGCTVVMRREEGVQRVEAAPPGTPLCWDDAALVPVASLGEGAAQPPVAKLSPALPKKN